MAAFTELLIEQGATFSTTINVEDTAGAAINLYGYTASSQMRKSYYSSSPTATFNTAISSNTGTITLSLSSTVTANIAPGRYVYDSIVSFEGAPGTANTVVRILEGVIDVSPSVTR